MSQTYRNQQNSLQSLNLKIQIFLKTLKSVLPILSKLLEKAVHQQLFEFLGQNNLLTDRQYGFWKPCSTKVATALLFDNICGKKDSGKLVSPFYLNLSTSFDTIGRHVLLNKLSSYGVIENKLVWLSDYLFSRS